MSSAGWVGRAWVRPGLMVVEGAIGTAGLHAHHTVQVISAASGVEIGDRVGVRAESEAVVIPADAVHEVVWGTGMGRLVHVDPESVAGARLTDGIRAADGLRGWVRAEVGLPLRPYMRWLRMQRAIRIVAEGNTVS
ncbi:hypothetical protein [Nocardia sp. IFM 10818]